MNIQYWDAWKCNGFEDTEMVVVSNYIISICGKCTIHKFIIILIGSN